MTKIKDSFGADVDAAENTARLVTEQALGKLVGAFERFAEALFAKAPGAPLKKVKRGSFQRLHEGSLLWREAVGKGYDDLLQPKEFEELLTLRSWNCYPPDCCARFTRSAISFAAARRLIVSQLLHWC